ncbi:unnamed protein product, partial [Allacma fusca]
LYENCLAEEP